MIITNIEQEDNEDEYHFLNRVLDSITKDFTHTDRLQYRKNRDWVKYDKSTQIGRLYIILKEVQKYKNKYEIHNR